MEPPSDFAMEQAAEIIGPDVLVRLNQKQLAKIIDRALRAPKPTPAEPMERFTKEEREALTFAGTCIERLFGEEPLGKAGEYHRILRALTPEPGEETNG